MLNDGDICEGQDRGIFEIPPTVSTELPPFKVCLKRLGISDETLAGIYHQIMAMNFNSNNTDRMASVRDYTLWYLRLIDTDRHRGKSGGLRVWCCTRHSGKGLELYLYQIERRNKMDHRKLAGHEVTRDCFRRYIETHLIRNNHAA